MDIPFGAFLFRFLTVLSLLISSLPVEAAKKKPAPEPDYSMRFAVVRSSDSACEPTCPEWIWAEGDIRPDTATRFKKFLKTIGDRKLPVVIQSPGGDLDAAFAMGRMIRARGLDVAVGYTTFATCVPRQSGCDAERKGGYRGLAERGSAYCESACPMILAAGTRRLVGAWAYLGVHQITTTHYKERITYRTTTRIVKGKKVTTKKIVGRKNISSYKTTKMDAVLRRKLTAYLDEMGVSLDLIEPIETTPASGMRQLTLEAMLEMKLVTSLDHVGDLTVAGVCRRDPMPRNCREVPLTPEMAAKLAERQKQAAAQAAAQTKLASAELAAKPPKLSAPPQADSQKVAVTGPKPSASDMQFRVVRHSDPQCGADCPQWISAEGTIVGDSPEKLARLLDLYRYRVRPLMINSNGGDIFAAVAIGRLLRERKLDVAVARTDFERCDEGQPGCGATEIRKGMIAIDGGECRAACTLVLAAGNRRLVDALATVGVRKLALTPKIRAYLLELPNGPGLLDLMQEAEDGSASVHGPESRELEPTVDQMRNAKLITHLGPAEQFLGPEEFVESLPNAN